MNTRLFCLGLSVDSADTNFKNFLKQLREDLNIVYDELHSEDEHDWMLFFHSDDQLLEKIKAAQRANLPSIRYSKYYVLASPNSHSVKQNGDKTVILNPKYGLLNRIDF